MDELMAVWTDSRGRQWRRPTIGQGTHAFDPDDVCRACFEPAPPAEQAPPVQSDQTVQVGDLIQVRHSEDRGRTWWWPGLGANWVRRVVGVVGDSYGMWVHSEMVDMRGGVPVDAPHESTWVTDVRIDRRREADQFRARFPDMPEYVVDADIVDEADEAGPARPIYDPLYDERKVTIGGQRMFPEDVENLIARGYRAWRLTREYIGEDRLPVVPGWEWFDWCRIAAGMFPDAADAEGWGVTWALRLDDWRGSAWAAYVSIAEVLELFDADRLGRRVDLLAETAEVEPELGGGALRNGERFEVVHSSDPDRWLDRGERFAGIYGVDVDGDGPARYLVYRDSHDQVGAYPIDDGGWRFRCLVDEVDDEVLSAHAAATQDAMESDFYKPDLDEASPLSWPADPWLPQRPQPDPDDVAADSFLFGFAGAAAALALGWLARKALRR